jgi:hypothetical protein
MNKYNLCKSNTSVPTTTTTTPTPTTTTTLAQNINTIHV